MTELLDGIADVRQDASGAIRAVRLAGGWSTVNRVANQWLVETDWWRTPVRRHYVRLLLASRRGGRRATGSGTADRREATDECVELYRDLETGEWHWSRRYD